MQVKDAANNTGTKALSIDGGGGSTATHSHDDITAWRDGRHGILNNAAGERWNDAIQLECECGDVASRVKSGDINGRNLRDSDHGGDCIIYGAR